MMIQEGCIISPMALQWPLLMVPSIMQWDVFSLKKTSVHLLQVL
jgi:hypothetical protein